MRKPSLHERICTKSKDGIGLIAGSMAYSRRAAIEHFLSIAGIVAAGIATNAMALSAFSDGAGDAPAGVPQRPTLLTAYRKRPPWNVPSVDYAVGIDRSLYPTNADLKAPGTGALPAGVSRNLTAHTLSINGSNVVFDGYDLSQDGGWMVLVDGGNNNTVQNCNFAVGTNKLTPIAVCTRASNTTIQKNDISGRGSAVQILSAINGIGTTMLLYNLVDMSWGQNIVFSSRIGGESLVLRFNVISNGGWGFGEGAHGDWIQCYNANGRNTDSFICEYNLWLQSIQIAQGRTQGISAFSANSGPTSGGCQTENFNNNTFIGVQGAYVNYAIILDTTRLIGSATIKDNYFDTSGIGSPNGGGGHWSFIGNYNGTSGGPYHGTVAVSGNINMMTGAPLTK